MHKHENINNSTNEYDIYQIKEQFKILKDENIKKKNNNVFILYYKHNPMKKTFFLTDHWFIDIPQLNIELHYGYNDSIQFKKSGSLHNFHVYSEIYFCNDCMLTFLETAYNDHNNNIPMFQPLINCESLSSMAVGNIGFSFQVFFLILIIMFIFLSFFQFAFIFFLPVTFLIYFFYVKRNYNNTYYQCCQHLNYDEKTN